jgi:hypothetical protein
MSLPRTSDANMQNLDVALEVMPIPRGNAAGNSVMR